MPAFALAPKRHPPSPRRRSKRSLQRRAARRRRAWLAAGVLGSLATAATMGLFALLGRAPEPVHSEQLAWAGRPVGQVGSPWPVASGAINLPAAASPPENKVPTATLGSSAAPTGATNNPSNWSNVVSAIPSTSAGARTDKPGLPIMPGTEVLETDTEHQAAAGSSNWTATLSSAEPMAQVAAYYRQQLGALVRPGGPGLTETSPSSGQLLISVPNPEDGSHSAVWIGETDGQVTIRLLRTHSGGP